LPATSAMPPPPIRARVVVETTRRDFDVVLFFARTVARTTPAAARRRADDGGSAASRRGASPATARVIVIVIVLGGVVAVPARRPMSEDGARNDATTRATSSGSGDVPRSPLLVMRRRAPRAPRAFDRRARSSAFENAGRGSVSDVFHPVEPTPPDQLRAAAADRDHAGVDFRRLRFGSPRPPRDSARHRPPRASPHDRTRARNVRGIVARARARRDTPARANRRRLASSSSRQERAREDGGKKKGANENRRKRPP